MYSKSQNWVLKFFFVFFSLMFVELAASGISAIRGWALSWLHACTCTLYIVCENITMYTAGVHV